MRAPLSEQIIRSAVTDVDEVLRSLIPERLTAELDPVWKVYIDEWGNEVLDDLGVAPAFDMLNPLVADHLENFSSTQIKGLVHNTTRNQLRASLLAGVRDGESVRELSKRVTSVFDAARGYRATRIARTEVLHSSNFATWSAQKQSGVVSLRRWVDTGDAETRDNHIAFGQLDPVGIDEPFVLGGLSAMYPGDFGIAEEDINCRCTTVAVIDDEPKSVAVLAVLWKVFDAKLIPWENAAIEAARRGFTIQQREIMAAVNRVF